MPLGSRGSCTLKSSALSGVLGLEGGTGYGFGVCVYIYIYTHKFVIVCFVYMYEYIHIHIHIHIPMSLAQKTRCALQQSGITALGLGAGKVYTVMGG